MTALRLAGVVVYWAMFTFGALCIGVGIYWSVGRAVAWCWRWRARRVATRSLMVEVAAITEIASRVRADVPDDVSPAWLAECVSNACENAKEMGL